MSRRTAWPERLYSALLYCYPGEFRGEYASEMRAAFRDRRREEAGPGGAGLALFTAAILGDTLANAAKEHTSVLSRDLRFALRVLRQTPSFTVAALLTLALGIGSATIVYSLVYSILLRPLPYDQPDRIVRIYETNRKLDINAFSASTPNFLSWQERATQFDGIAAIRENRANLVREGEPERFAALGVSANFWRMLGLAPVAGRAFTAEEDRPGRDGVVMLSERLWRSRFAGSRTLLGQAIPINGVQRVVVGIAPSDVGFSSTIDVWMPLAPDPANEHRGDHRITVLGRLKPGVTVAQADAELKRIAAGLEREFPKTNTGWSIRLAPILHWITSSDLRTSLWVLLGAVGLLLLVACSNVANLLLARAATRRREIGVRIALGASRGRLLRQLLTESLLLACLGSVLGLGLAAAGIRALAALLPPDTSRIDALTLNTPVLLFAVALTFACALLFGLAPAWLAGRGDVNHELKQSAPSTAGAGAGILRNALVAVQMGLATVLVLGALLLLQSFQRLQGQTLGFDPENILTARISLPPEKYTSLEQAHAFYARLQEEARAIPGASSIALTSEVPLGGGDTVMHVAPFEQPHAQAVQASWRLASADYLQTLRVPLLRGRFFNPGEAGKPLPALLSDGLARRLWPNQDPVGREIAVGDMRQRFMIVGVVGDVPQLTIARGPRFTMYFPMTWYLWDPMTLVVRSNVPPETLAAAVRAAVLRVDPVQPVHDVQTLQSTVARNTAEPRLHSSLLAVFAALALILGAVGVAGVIAYTVARRTPEIAIRMALGASPGRVLRELTGAGLRVCLIGLAAGLLGAAAFARALSSLLFRTQPYDPLTFGVTAALLLTVAVLACWLPARRATRIQPSLALRSE